VHGVVFENLLNFTLNSPLTLPLPTVGELRVLGRIHDSAARTTYEGCAFLCGGALDEHVFEGLDALVRDQIMSMKTTFTPGHYRRRVAGVLARRLVRRLFVALE
jgi:hypothetical protein